MRKKEIRKILLSIVVVIIWLALLLFFKYLHLKSYISDDSFFLLGEFLAMVTGAFFGSLLGSAFTRS